ncbi:ABC transporter substrate-binding protein [Sporomusa sp. KB1]|jgi:iron complex transport system substrate-binding protein|uniref:ABC transporter substrate-binding protein n=1 Tax=Sporomusa sp. KB1 TaxID=943346 RepID=UPI0011A5EF57|nr:ABC transporter substrate-binding protein [Sporomusa sp. KB1]TWH45529.1 iron complex transport system substrate-binding protein [Sporomusa sp. KB1]
MSYKSVYRNSFILVTLLLLILTLAGCGSEQTAAKQEKVVITDSAKAKIAIPAKIESIADAWPAHNEVLTMLGAGDKIKATVDIKGARPWLYIVNPAMNDAQIVFTPQDVNIEELMKTKPDIVFISKNNVIATRLKAIGIPVVQLFFTDFAGLKDCFRTTGTILGPEAKAKADAYIAYLDEKMAKIKAVTDPISQEQRPKVLHINSWNPLLIDGTNTIIDNWIEVAGGTNAALDVKGNMKPVTMEQVMVWNPDVIIVSSNALPIEPDGTRNIHMIMDNPVWQGIKAVQNKKVYVNPDGAFLWDRYGAEEALQIQWAAKTLYPEKFQDIDIVKETRYFYKIFMNYDLSEAEANRIISGKNPE